MNHNQFWSEVKTNNIQDKLFNTVCYMTGNHHDAEDICQQTFLNALKDIHNFRGEASISTYLHQIAINLCRRHCGKDRSAQLPDSEIITDDCPPPHQPGIFSGLAPHPAETLVQKDRDKIIQSALDRLAPLAKQVVLLKDMQDLTYAEIAQVLDMSMQNVRTCLTNAREQLKGLLKEFIT
ncbi:MAG: RNA polymerase sigma factor [Planctomycetes bacterium]|nr:RNA polymerase sigma factor [Planctomycetota bacterium]